MKKISGGYVLVMEALNPSMVQVGKLGEIQLIPGLYYYGGSAKRGLAARIERHFKESKKTYWHIDYMTTHPQVDIVEAWCYPDQADIEHQLSGLDDTFLDDIPRGFGAGDCQSGCPAHLWRAQTQLEPEMISEDYYIIKHVSKYSSE